MKEKTINHALRNITLKYDSTKPETDYEKNLIKEYIAQHDAFSNLKKESARLIYFFQEHNDNITNLAKEFQPVSQGILNIVEQVKQFTSSNEKSNSKAYSLNDLIHDYHPNIEEFQSKLDLLVNESDQLQSQYNAYDALEEKFNTDFDLYHNETCHELYHNYDSYSLDMISYDDDEQEFRGCMDAPDNFYDERDKVIDHYNEVLNSISATYKQWEDAKKLLANYFDDDHLLDSSLSDSFKGGRGDHALSPVYLISPDEAMVESYRNAFSVWANSKNKSFSITTPVDVVDTGDVSMIQEMIMTLQHFPKLIEKTVFALDFKFINELEKELTEDQWKGLEPPMRWFNKMSSLPCIIFFLFDHDARAYTLMGDLVADKKLKMELRGKDQSVLMEGEILEEVANRLFNSCWFFLLYCHNTGFNPESYIEAIIADFDLPFTYKDVFKQYQEDILKGIKLRIK